MKAETLFRPAFGLFIIVFLSFCLMAYPLQVKAENGEYQEPSEKFSQEQLAQMLAPIALYPDALLSQVLMASTYPIEVVEADRWVQRNPGLKGEDLDAALLDMEWDPSVKAVCHFPSILALMSERISETTDLGNAFLAQEAEVMDMVQELRAKAHAQNHLVTDARQKVIVEDEKIIIEPADPTVIYVSYYDPSYVYGPWWYPAYPPYYWGPPGVRIGVGISYWPAFYFGFTFGSWSRFDWHRHYIHMDVERRPRFVRHDRWRVSHGRWFHAPEHRRGVIYRDRSTAWKYGQPPHRSGDFQRDPRAFPDHRVPDHNRHGGDRNRIDPSKHRGWDPKEADRERPERVEPESKPRERERVETESKPRERIDRNRREQPSVQPPKQERESADRERKIREQAERNRQTQQQAERDKQTQQQVERRRQERERGDAERKERQWVEHSKPAAPQVYRGGQGPDNSARDRQERERAETERIARERVETERIARERVERERQQSNTKNVSPPVDENRSGRPSGTRSGGNFQGSGDNPRGRGHSGDADRGGNDDRGGHGRR